MGLCEVHAGSTVVALDIGQGNARLFSHVTVAILLVSNQRTSRAATKALTLETMRVKSSVTRVMLMWTQYKQDLLVK